MKTRMRVSVTALTVLLGAIWLTSDPAAGQQAATSPGAADTSYRAPRTPDGRPDLQGFWSNATYTPLERPQNVDKEFYTPEEFEQTLANRAERDAQQTTPGTTADVHYDFTQFGLDKSQHTIVQNLRTSQIIDPPDGRMPEITADARARAAADAAARKQRGGQYDAVQNMPNGSRCIIMGGVGPPLRDAGYNSNYHIVQSPGHVMILTEMIHDARIIPLDGRPAPDEGLRQWIGVSRGRWEGETLVVETTNLNGRNPFGGGRGGGAGSTEHLKVTERFTRISDEQIEYRFTIDDPHTWTRPFTGLTYLQQTVGPLFEFACHETNYGVANILAGARAEETRAADEAAGRPESR